MKKTLLLLAMALVSLCSNAQNFTAKREAPAPPKFTAWAAETEAYMWNVSFGGFFINHQGGDGAPYYGTAASVNDTVGSTVIFTRTNPNSSLTDEEKEAWSAANENTYLLVNYVTKFKENRCAFTDGWMWTDNNSQSRRFFDIDVDADGTFTFTGNYTCISVMEAGLDDIWTGKPLGVNKDRIVQIGEPNNKWALVSAEDYEAYMADIDAKMETLSVISAANSLRAAIESAVADYDGIDISAALAVYNDEAATVEQLTAGLDLVKQAIADHQKKQASADNPADFTGLVPNADFEGGNDGWTTTTGAANKGTATNRCDNVAYPGTTMTGKFWENWNSSAYDGKMYTQITDLPAGVYKVKMAAFINPGNSGYVYMNSFKTNKNGKTSDGKTVTLGQGNDIPADFEVFGYINDGDTLEIGLEVSNKESNWIGIDNVQLTYYGAEIDAYKLWYNQERATIIETMNALVTPETKYDKTQKELFNAALTTGDNATTKEALIEAVANLTKAADASYASIAAYAELVEKVKEYQNDETEYDEEKVYGYFRDLIGATDVSDGQEAIDAIKEALEAEGEKCPIEVSPIEILETCAYSTEFIQAYIPALKDLHDICASLSMIEGTDITSMLTDAKFTDPNGKGWTREKGNITWRGGFHAFPVAESYHSAFDFYQEVIVPNGIYSLSLNGFCRPDDGETDPAAEIYMNDYATKFQSLAGGALKEEPVDGFNCYLSQGETGAYHSNPIFAENDAHNSPANNLDKDNGEGYVPDGMEGASIAFSANRYQAKVYGMVENGKIKLGARCSSTHQWVLWGNFVLKYEGESDEAMMALAESFVGPAQQYLDDNSENMSTPSVEALEAAIAAVNNGQTAAEIKEAIKTMNAALEDAKANVVAVAAFQAAKDAMTEAADNAEAPSAEASKTYDELSGVEYAELTTDQINEYVKKFDDCAAALRIPAYEDASDENPVDMTQVILNPDFEANSAGQQATGWTLVKGEGASGNYQVQTGFDGVGMEFWSDTNGSGTKFDFYQEIANLPAGTYELTVDAANSLNGKSAGDGTGAVYVYAAGVNGEKINYVNGDPVEVQEAGCADAHGTYTVIIKLAEGETLRVGAMNVGQLSARWVMVDNFKLTYYGTESAKTPSEGHETVIKDAQTVSAPAAIYSISGAKLNSLKQGINIVKGADGSVRKIFVK